MKNEVRNIKNQSEFVKKASINKKLNQIYDFCNALRNRTRILIFVILMKNKRCVCELEAILDKSQPTISHHLRILERVSLITSKKIGKFSYYEIVKEQLDKFLHILNEEFND